MGRKRKAPESPEPPPFAAWQTSRLIALTILLPLIGTALLAYTVVLTIRAIRPDGDAPDSWLGVLMMAVLGLWSVGMTWVLVVEMRRRKQFPSEEETRARAEAFAADVAEAREQGRSAFRAGLWGAALGLPGTMACLAYRWAGREIPELAEMATLPLTAAAPLCWMLAAKREIALWIHQQRPTKYLAWSGLGLALYVVLVVLFIFPYLRKSPETAPESVQRAAVRSTST